MNYTSTRGIEEASVKEAIANGMAADMGFYINEKVSEVRFTVEMLLMLDAKDIVAILLNALLPGFDNMRDHVEKAYADKFDDENLAVILDYGKDFMLELGHGPNGSYKDFANLMLKEFGADENLCAANIAGLAALTTCYFLGYKQLLEKQRIEMDDAIDVIVPSADFGLVLAAFYAKVLGLPIGKIICAEENGNNLANFFKNGKCSKEIFSANLERLLYLASDGDYALIKTYASSLDKDDSVAVNDKIMGRLRTVFEVIPGNVSSANENYKSKNRCILVADSK